MNTMDFSETIAAVGRRRQIIKKMMVHVYEYSRLMSLLDFGPGQGNLHMKIMKTNQN